MRLGSTGWRHPKEIRGVAFAGRDRLLVSACAVRTRVWDTSTGILRLDLERGSCRPAISPKGDSMVVASQSVKLFDIATGRCCLTFEQTERPLRVVCFEPSAKRLVGGTVDGTLVAWDATGQIIAQRQSVHSGQIVEVVISPASNLVASLGDGGDVVLSEVASLEPRPLASCWPDDHTTAIGFGSAAHLLAIGYQNGLIRLVNVRAGTTVASFEGHDRAIRALWLDSARKLLVSASDDQSIRLWNVDNAECITTLGTQFGEVGGLAVSSQGEMLAVATGVGIQRWALPQGRPLGEQGPFAEIRVVACSPDDRLIATASGNHCIRLWDAASGQQLRRLSDHQWRIRGLAFSPDGGLLASGGLDHNIRLEDVHTGEQLAVIKRGSANVNCLTFSPDGRVLAAGHDSHIQLWEVPSGERLRQLSGHRDGVHCVAFSPDGTLLISGGADGTLRLWDPDTGKQRGSVKPHGTGVRTVAFSPDGRMLASGGDDAMFRLWEVSPHDAPGIKELAEVACRSESGIRALTFLGDGVLLAQQDWGRAITLWDVHTQTVVRRLEPDFAVVEARAPSTGRERLVTGLSDGTTVIWDLSAVPRSPKSLTRCRELYTLLLERTGEQHTELTCDPDGMSLSSNDPHGSVRCEFQLRAEGYVIAISAETLKPDPQHLERIGRWFSERFSNRARTRATERAADHRSWAIAIQQRLGGLATTTDCTNTTLRASWRFETLPSAHYLADVFTELRQRLGALEP